MDLRHLRYFIAVAEEGSLTVAAEKRLHTAQPSLSRQMRDLEAELGCALMIRGAKGIELTAAGRVFLDQARVVLLQVEAAIEATRRAAVPAKASFVLGFLTGHEFEWLPAVMAIMRDELPNTEVVILSLSSPDLADGLMRGKIDLAFLRHERNAPGIVFTRLIDEPLIVLMPADHRLAARDAITAEDIAGEQLVGVPHDKSPALRAVTDAYGARLGIDLTPDHNVDNLSMAVSLVASTGGIALMPLYARNLLPPTVPPPQGRCVEDWRSEMTSFPSSVRRPRSLSSPSRCHRSRLLDLQRRAICPADTFANDHAGRCLSAPIAQGRSHPSERATEAIVKCTTTVTRIVCLEVEAWWLNTPAR